MRDATRALPRTSTAPVRSPRGVQTSPGAVTALASPSPRGDLCRTLTFRDSALRTLVPLPRSTAL